MKPIVILCLKSSADPPLRSLQIAWLEGIVTSGRQQRNGYLNQLNTRCSTCSFPIMFKLHWNSTVIFTGFLSCWQSATHYLTFHNLARNYLPIDILWQHPAMHWQQDKDTCTDVANYHKVSNIRLTLVGNKVVDHSDVVGALPVGAAPTTSSFSRQHLASMDWAKTTARWDEKHLCFGIRCILYQRIDGRWSWCGISVVYITVPPYAQTFSHGLVMWHSNFFWVFLPLEVRWLNNKSAGTSKCITNMCMAWLCSCVIYN